MLRIFSTLFLVLVTFNCSLFPRDDSRKDSTAYEKLYDQLMHLTVDGAAVATVSNLSIKRDEGTFWLQEGKLFLCKPINGRVISAIFEGIGRFYLTPPDFAERQQLNRFYKVDSIKQNFSQLFLLFSDSTLIELKRNLSFVPEQVPGSVSGLISDCLKYISEEDDDHFDTDLMQTFLDNRPNRMFYTHFCESNSDPFFFQINPYDDEEVSFAQRAEVSFRHYRETVTKFKTKEERSSNYSVEQPSKEQIQIIDYKIDSKINNDLEFSSTANVTFISSVDSLRYIPFSLFSKLIVDSIVSSDGMGVKYFQHEDNPIVWVELPHLLSKDEKLSLTFFYKGELLTHDLDGWIGLKSTVYWYPRSGYWTRANYDLTFHTPSKLKLASIGKNVSTEQTGDTIISRWITVRPTHNASFGIGYFKEIKIKEEDLSVEKQAGETLPNVTVYGLEADRSIGNAHLDDEVRGDILNCMRFFQYMFGKSPADDFYAIAVPTLGGEAFLGLIHLSYTTFKYFDGDGGNEIFRAHEVAHQWWGVGVNFKTYHDQWISEGFSEYSGILFMQTVLKDNEKFFKVLDAWKETILNNRHYLLDDGQEAGPIWLGYRTQSSNTVGDYSLIIYKKGAWVLHMLRNMMIDLKTMNEDRFRDMMREFYSTYLWKEPSTEDFQRMVSKHMGEDMSWFFKEWIKETGIPKYKFAYHTEKTEAGKYKVHCRVKQENVADDFKMVVPMLIKFEGNKLVRLRVTVSKNNSEFELPLLPLEPEEIIFNDLNSVLCEVDNEDWD